MQAVVGLVVSAAVGYLAIAFLIGLFSGSFLLSVGIESAFDVGVQMLIYSGAVLVGDDGFDGTVVKVATRGIEEDVAACSGAVLPVVAILAAACGGSTTSSPRRRCTGSQRRGGP